MPITLASAPSTQHLRETWARLYNVCFMLTHRSKTNTKNVLGPEGVRLILETLAVEGYSIPCVCIGGINTTNAQSIVAETRGPRYGLNGIAVVSVIMGADDPKDAARQLLKLIQPVLPPKRVHQPLDIKSIASFASVIKAVHDATPLSHNMTNLVCSLVLRGLRASQKLG